MLNDYKYLKMAAQNEFYGTTNVPYCLINTDKTFIADTALEPYLQPILQGDRGSKIESVTEFMRNIRLDKLSWKCPVHGVEREVDKRYGAINLDTSTYSSLINTGIEDLLVGDKIFALPAISYLAKNNPTVSIFTYKNKTYVHPMIISWEVRSRLVEDLMMIDFSAQEAKTSTIVGGMIKNVVNELGGTDLLELEKLITYIILSQPIGKVEYSLEGNRHAIYNVEPTRVSVGGKFVCLNNLFV